MPPVGEILLQDGESVPAVVHNSGRGRASGAHVEGHATPEEAVDAVRGMG
jgi:hypothetical protein